MDGPAGKSTRDDRYCPGCTASLSAPARFCPRCGLAVASHPFREGRGAVFGLLALALFSGVVIAGWSAVWSGEYGGLYGAQARPETGPVEATLELAAADVRHAADELFNQVVDAAVAGDTMQLQAFLPMAVMAYQEASPLDADGLFHLSTLQRIGNTPEESLASARWLLERDPNHLLGLGAAAEASLELGWDDEAASYYARLVEVFDAQVERPLAEYLGHSDLLERMKGDAEAFLGVR